MLHSWTDIASRRRAGEAATTLRNHGERAEIDASLHSDRAGTGHHPSIAIIWTVRRRTTPACLLQLPNADDNSDSRRLWRGSRGQTPPQCDSEFARSLFRIPSSCYYFCDHNSTIDLIDTYETTLSLLIPVKALPVHANRHHVRNAIRQPPITSLENRQAFIRRMAGSSTILQTKPPF